MADAYQVVRDFEAELSRYTGAPFVVTTNSCSMAIQLAVRCQHKDHRKWTSAKVEIPARTYCSVPMAVIHAGGIPVFTDEKWFGSYQLRPLPVWDCARRFTKAMYTPGQFQCVSFQSSKILGLEQGGAILHDDEEADTWLRRARFDGRDGKTPVQIGWHCYLNPSTAALGLSRLASLPGHNEPQGGYERFEDLSKLSIW